MSDREKLIELIRKGIGDIRSFELIQLKLGHAEEIADRLISNGVTVQKWIPVSEPPKEYKDKYGELIPFLVCGKDTEYPYRALYDGETWGDGMFSVYPTHWMPLPSPPKECE